MIISVVLHPIKISGVDATGTSYRQLYICRVTGTQTVHTNLVLIGAELAEKQDYRYSIIKLILNYYERCKIFLV